MEITEEKKIIPAKTVVKALITGFVSYGIVIGFLLFTIALVVNTFVYNIPNANQKVLAFSLPLLFAFILYFSIHSICRLSTSDLFNKCKTEWKLHRQVTLNKSKTASYKELSLKK